MTSPPELPPLPAVRTSVPPRGFDRAVRAAGRRRWRRLGESAGALAAAVAVVLAVPAAPGGTAGLEPTNPAVPRPAPADRPDGAATGAPAAGPGAGSAQGNAARGPDGTRDAGVDAAGPAAYPAPSPAPGGQERPAGADPSPASPGATPAAAAPWQRSEEDADLQALASCVDGGVGEGSNHGDWCLTAAATGAGDEWSFRLSACATHPAAQPLVFTDGRELDFVLLDGGTFVWSSGRHHVFPAEGNAVKADYGRCTVWKTAWDRRGDDGRRVAGGQYTLAVTLRLVDRTPSDKQFVNLGD